MKKASFKVIKSQQITITYIATIFLRLHTNEETVMNIIAFLRIDCHRLQLAGEHLAAQIVLCRVNGDKKRVNLLSKSCQN